MAELPRLCIFGDSHYACVRQAEAQGLVDVSGVELEYWGHLGTRFRHLEFRDGAIHPLDDFTARRFAKFNARGRMFLPAAEFDVILVVGARIYVWRMFLRLLQMLAGAPLVSEGLQRRVLADGMRQQAGYRLVSGLAATGTARLLLSPIAFFSPGHALHAAALEPRIQALIPEALPRLWELLAAVVAEDGLTLMPQAAETVVQGLFTDPTYAVSHGDFEHRNAAYGAVVLSRAMEFARQVPRRS